MSAGTITLTNGSAVVTGAGTAFTTELAARDFIVATIGGITYTLPVQSVDSDTQVTLISNFPGPTQAGSAWSAVPWKTQQRITAELVSQTTEALRGQNYDKRNWQAVFSASGDITVMLPDGSTFTGPSWQKIAKLATDSDFESIKPLAEQIHRDSQQVEADKAATAASAANAVTSEDNAAKSEQNAARSETNAAGSATGAADHEALARKYAVNPEGAEVVAGEFSARHYAAKAQKSAEESAAHNPGESLGKALNLSDLADRAAAWLNVRPIGATPLAADPVGPYDAATRRWVENLIGAGITGPTLNGIMNHGVGIPFQWTSRAFIPGYALPMDGQLVRRADWPDLWAHAQQHGAISDADWIATRTSRGQYSTGDGNTTFRLPDFNGKRRKGDMIDGVTFTGDDSIHALFFRGDGVDPGDNAGSAPGIIRPSAIPKFTAAFDLRGTFSGGQGYSPITNTTGAAYSPGAQSLVTNGLQLGDTTSTWRVSIDPSRVSSVYGQDSTPEARPNSVLGVWCVRASGAFTAANTSWSVLNGDKTLPGNGVATAGGSLLSRYQVAGADSHFLELKSIKTVGQGRSRATLTAWNAGVNSANFDFFSDGDFSAPKSVFSGAGVVSSASGLTAGFNKFVASADYAHNNAIYYVESPAHNVLCYNGTQSGLYYYHAWRLTHDTNQNKYWLFRSDGQTASPLGLLAVQGSDVRIKDNFQPAQDGAWERVQQIGIMEFCYKGQTIVQRGYLAQQMFTIDPVYTFEGGKGVDDMGNEFEILNVNDRAVMSDLITVVQMLQNKIKVLEEKINLTPESQ